MNKITTRARSLIIQKIRDFFVQNDFLEVETPIMTPIPGMEPHLTPFETTLTPPAISQLSSATKIPMYLNTSPELQMKKLLGSPEGFDKIFNITKVFRNGEMDGPLHNTEFTMLEWYRKNADYKDLMNDCENLVTFLICKILPREANQSVNTQTTDNLTVNGQTQNYSILSQVTKSLSYQSSTINLATPWPRFTTNELFIKYCDLDLLENQDFATFKKTIDEKASSHTVPSSSASPFPFDSSGCATWDDLYFKIFLNYIEPELAKINQPIFIYDYPSSQAALAKRSADNTFFAERFELYIKGIELANAFSELTDSKEQRARLEEEQNLRKQLDKTVFPIDEEFLTALDKIATPTSGIALGLDRLIMLLLDKKSIEEVLLFPMNNLTSLANTLAQR